MTGSPTYETGVTTLTRRLVYRVIVIALLIWVGSQVAVAGESSNAVDIHSPEMVQAPAHPDGMLGSAGHAPADQFPHREAGTPFAGLDSDTVVEWMNTMLLSQTAGVEGAAWIVPSAALATGGSHRTDEDPSFENERRKAIYQEIAESPGHYITALATSTGFPESTVRYHVRVLEDDGLVRSALIRGKRHCYPPDMDRWVVTLEAALADDSIASILEAIARLEPATVTTLAETADVTPSTASYHLGRLAADDLVDRERTGQTVLTRLDADVRAYLDELDEFGVSDTDAMTE